MKLTIQKEDLDKIWGKYIFQVDTHENWDLTKCIREAKIKKQNHNFWFAKRIGQFFLLESRVYHTDLYGNMYKYADSVERFLELFNDYKIISNRGSEHEADQTGKRFHRLLTSSELKLVFKFIKKRNY